MRLLDCQLQNVRLHGALAVAFSPRLTLIGGPNESGKTTLVEALHRALFLKASATGAPVKALQSRVHLGQPVVQLRFEARGSIWNLRKRFSGNTGQVSLSAEGRGEECSGPAAEDALADLLGVPEIVGGMQARSVLTGRWAHLWVRQGSSGEDLLTADRSHYDFDQLRLQLERSGGAAVQQSAHDQRVEQRIQELLDANLTTRGAKAKSPLWLREQERDAARERMAQAMARLEEYETASEELARIGEQLQQLQTVDLPALLAQQEVLQQAGAEAARLDNAILLAVQVLEPIRLRHDAAVQALQQLESLQGEIEQRQQRLSELELHVAGADQREQDLTAAGYQRRSTWDSLMQQRQTLEQRQQLLQRLMERLSKAETLQRLNAEISRIQQNARQRQTLEQQLADLPKLTRPQLQQLRQLDQQQRDCLARLEAIATGITLLRADQPVRIDGQLLPPGEPRRLGALFQVQVGEGVVLEIDPGGGQARDQLEASLQSTGAQLSAGLAAIGVINLEAAEALLEQRTGLEQQRAGLGETTPETLESLEQQRADLDQRLQQLERELAELEPIRKALEEEQPLPMDPAALQELLRQIGSTLRHTTTAAGEAERELEAARGALQQFRHQRLAEASQLEVVRAELSDRRQRQADRVKERGDRNSQLAEVSALQAQRQQAETELAGLRGQRASLGEQNTDRRLQQIRERLEALSRSQEQWIDQRGAAKQRCDSISAEDPYAAVEQARLQQETAEAEHRQLRRVIDAHALLRDLFLEAQADLSSRYSEPLAEAIGSYLRPLVPDGPVAHLHYDASSGFSGLQLRRGQEFYDFEALSGGMREQLAAALRLSMADVLKDAHDGCLPLVFDDAFTHSDPERVRLVKQMLNTAVDRGLQVILLTCDPQAYAGFADLVVEL